MQQLWTKINTQKLENSSSARSVGFLPPSKLLQHLFLHSVFKFLCMLMASERNLRAEWECTAENMIWITYGFLQKCIFVSRSADSGDVPGNTQKSPHSFLLSNYLFTVGSNFFKAFSFCQNMFECNITCAANNPYSMQCLGPYDDRSLHRALPHLCTASQLHCGSGKMWSSWHTESASAKAINKGLQVANKQQEISMYLPCLSNASVEKLKQRGQSLLSCSVSGQGKAGLHLLLFLQVHLFPLTLNGADYGAEGSAVVHLS